MGQEPSHEKNAKRLCDSHDSVRRLPSRVRSVDTAAPSVSEHIARVQFRLIFLPYRYNKEDVFEEASLKARANAKSSHASAHLRNSDRAFARWVLPGYA